VVVESEFSHYPLGFVLAVDSPAADSRLVDITFFAGFGFDEYKAVFMQLPVLPVFSPFPTDFREEAEVWRDSRVLQSQAGVS
jgi:hypothetical protein